ncbi:hypothetical protein HMI55_000087 [Coelomomyces lativittatus]|nr:hypothetical protein HMI55_000087 [Coelomomyces lativittatus]
MEALDWQLNVVSQKLERAFSSPAIQLDAGPPSERMPTPLEHPGVSLDLNELHLTLLWKLEHLETLKNSFRENMSSSCPALSTFAPPHPDASIVLKKLEHQLVETQALIPKSFSNQVELKLAMDLVQQCQQAYTQVHHQWAEIQRNSQKKDVIIGSHGKELKNEKNGQQSEKWKMFQWEAEQYFKIKNLPEILQSETTNSHNELHFKNHPLSSFSKIEEEETMEVQNNSQSPSLNSTSSHSLYITQPPSSPTSQTTDSMIIFPDDDIDPLDQTQVNNTQTIHVHVELVDGPPVYETYEIRPSLNPGIENHSSSWPPAAPKSSMEDLVDNDEESEPLNSTFVGNPPAIDALTMKLKALNPTFHASELPTEPQWNTVSSM